MNEFQAYSDLSKYLDVLNLTAYSFVVFFVTVFITFILIVTPFLAFKVTLNNAIEQAKKSDDDSVNYAYAKASGISVLIFLSATFTIEFIFVTVFGVWNNMGEVINTVFFLGF